MGGSQSVGDQWREGLGTGLVLPGKLKMYDETTTDREHSSSDYYFVSGRLITCSFATHSSTSDEGCSRAADDAADSDPDDCARSRSAAQRVTTWRGGPVHHPQFQPSETHRLYRVPDGARAYAGSRRWGGACAGGACG
jgi:hypothetical protein